MASTNVTFDILANDRASDKFDHLSRSVDHSGGALGKFSSIAKSAAKAGALALGAGLVVATKGLYDMAQAAVEDEAAASRLAQTLKTTAGATDAQIASVERWITAQGKALGVADDDLRPALQRLTEATHDVGKSQELATLAMDVAAAKGKPLVTISEALMKAYNGNIGALGRLGIKTKDAAGETITFDEAVRQMSDTFGGAAEKNADTLAGKMDRLKISLSETGEEIGAKLLPYVADAADLFVQKGIPAIEDFGDKAGPVFKSVADGAEELWDAVKPAIDEIAEALGHLVKEGGGVGNVFEDQILPAVKIASDVIGGFVDFVDDLPGPVKEVAAQVGIAALAFGKMSSAIKGMAFTSFIADMKTAETRTTALSGAAKNAAGIGGLLLLTHAFGDAKSEGNKFMGVLEGFAAGGALGFAAGGPIGALIGAAAGGGLMGLTAAFSDTADEAKDARRELLKSQGFEDAKADAEKLSEALQGVANEYGNVAIASVKASFVDPATGQLEADVQLLRDMGISMDTIASATLGQKDALAVVSAALNSYGDDLDSNLSKAEDHLADLLQQSNDYAQRKPGEIIEPVDPEDLAKASEAVENAQDVLDDYNVTQGRFGERVSESSAVVQAHKEKVRELADQLNITTKQYQKWPKRVRTDIEAGDLPETSRGVLRLIDQFKGLQSFDRIRTLVEATGVQLTDREVQQLQKRYGLTPKQVKTLIQIEGVPGAISSINAVESQLRDLDSTSNDVHNYIYTHHQNAGGQDGGPDVYGEGNQNHRMMGDYLPGSQLPGPPMTAVPVGRSAMTGRGSNARVVVKLPERMVLQVRDREFDVYVGRIAAEQIDQHATFVASQGD